jgi:predicted heme/steroid binding protein
MKSFHCKNLYTENNKEEFIMSKRIKKFVTLVIVFTISSALITSCQNTNTEPMTSKTTSAPNITISAPNITTSAPNLTISAPNITISAPNNMQLKSPAQNEKTFTLEELKQYDGKDGKPGYVAISGKVYDVTNAKGWKNGKHKGYSAGNDLTEVLTKAPHGNKVLPDLPVVGVLAK